MSKYRAVLLPKEISGVEYTKIEVISKVIIGRKSYPELKSNLISGNHCEIYERNGKFYAKDISANGTFVNGTRIKHKVEVELQNGDELSLVVPSSKCAKKKLPLYVVLIEQIQSDSKSSDDASTQELKSSFDSGEEPNGEKPLRRKRERSFCELSNNKKAKLSSECINISKLEESILHNIFSFLPCYDICCGNIFAVCKNFYKISSPESTFWSYYGKIAFTRGKDLFKEVNWKSYVLERAKLMSEVQRKLVAAALDDQYSSEIISLAGALEKQKTADPNVTFIKYEHFVDSTRHGASDITLVSRTESSVYLWSVAFPIYVRFDLSIRETFDTYTGKTTFNSTRVVLDDVNLELQSDEPTTEVQIDGTLLSSVRDSLGFQMTAKEFFNYLMHVCKYEGRWPMQYIIVGADDEMQTQI